MKPLRQADELHGTLASPSLGGAEGGDTVLPGDAECIPAISESAGMIEFQALCSSEPGDWRRMVFACDGQPLNLPEVYLADDSRRECRFVVAREGGAIVACGLALESRRRFFGVAVGGKTLTLPTALATKGRNVPQRMELYRCLAAFARKSGYRRLIVHHNWGEDFSAEPSLAGSISGQWIDFTIDLARPLDKILGAMEKYHRKNIRRAERGGLEIVDDRSLEALLTLRELQIYSSARAGEKGNRFAISDERFFRRLHERLYRTDVANVAFAKFEGEYIAGLAYLRAGSKAITVRSGAKPAANDLYAMYLLQYHLIARLKKEGIAELNIGAVPAEAVEEAHPQHGLYRFKRGFGGTEFLRTAVDLDLSRLDVA